MRWLGIGGSSSRIRRQVSARLRRVVVLNRPALDVIKTQDGPNTLFYLDPPYLHETRVTTSDYQHEMTPDEVPPGSSISDRHTRVRTRVSRPSLVSELPPW